MRTNTSRILLATGTEDPSLRIDHDNSSLATGAALSGDDRYLFVSLETSRQLAVYDLQDGYQLMRLPTGRAPQSVALSSDGRTAYVHDFMDRQISHFDLTQMLETNLPAANALPPIQTVSVEALPPTILQGKQLFYDAADDRLSLDDYLSCASCHNDGDGDGRVWDLGGFRFVSSTWDRTRSHELSARMRRAWTADSMASPCASSPGRTSMGRCSSIWPRKRNTLHSWKRVPQRMWPISQKRQGDFRPTSAVIRAR